LASIGIGQPGFRRLEFANHFLSRVRQQDRDGHNPEDQETLKAKGSPAYPVRREARFQTAGESLW